MVNKKLLTMALGLALIVAPAVIVHAQQGPSPRAWEPAPPPPNWSQAAHDGYLAGVDAARADISAGRSLDPNRHDEFRHPSLPSEECGDYRMGFRRGYRVVADHLKHPDRDRAGLGAGL